MTTDEKDMGSPRAAMTPRMLLVLALAASFLMLAVLPDGWMARDPDGLGKYALFRLLGQLPLMSQIVHLAFFAGLTVACAWALKPRFSASRCLVMAAALAFAFGVLVEGVQLFVPGREAGLLDLALNGIGVLGGALAVNALSPNPVQQRRLS